jgi:hypothetical protein
MLSMCTWYFQLATKPVVGFFLSFLVCLNSIGTYKNITGPSASCFACPDGGSSGPPAATDINQCSCPSGKTRHHSSPPASFYLFNPFLLQCVGTTGSPPSCINCVAGTYKDDYGSHACSACPLGSNSSAGAAMCTDIDECLSMPCSPLTTCTNLIASFNCSDCPFGLSSCSFIIPYLRSNHYLILLLLRLLSIRQPCHLYW